MCEQAWEAWHGRPIQECQGFDANDSMDAIADSRWIASGRLSRADVEITSHLLLLHLISGKLCKTYSMTHSSKRSSTKAGSTSNSGSDPVSPADTTLQRGINAIIESVSGMATIHVRFFCSVGKGKKLVMDCAVS
jgi:hypothetical protein